MTRVITALAAAILIAAVGCDSKPTPQPAPMPTAPASGAAKVKDLVCGMDVAADAPLSLDHEGKTYRFCAQGCLDKFKAEPAKYIQK
ncbi:MAG: YHS domain-containing protein [Planctomycetota bacterium]